MILKIIMGPEFMRVSRYGIESIPVPADSSVEEAYRLHVHDKAVKHIRSRLRIRATRKQIRIQYTNILIELANQNNGKLYFDGPTHFVSFKPWKEARYGEFTYVDPVSRNILRKMYQ